MSLRQRSEWAGTAARSRIEPFIAGIGITLAALHVGCVEERQYDPPPPSAPQLRLPQNNAYEGSVLDVSLTLCANLL